MSALKRAGRALLLGLLAFGQGRLILHHHVSVADTRVSAFSRHAEATEAACPTCELASRSVRASVGASPALSAPARLESIVAVSEVSSDFTSSIRLAARAPPAC